MSKTRQIEIYVGYEDHTWDTEMIEIPADTLDEEIDEKSIEEGERMFINNSATRDPVVFVGVYQIPDIEAKE